MPKRAQPKRKVPARRKRASSALDLKKEIAGLKREVERLQQQRTGRRPESHQPLDVRSASGA